MYCSCLLIVASHYDDMMYVITYNDEILYAYCDVCVCTVRVYTLNRIRNYLFLQFCLLMYCFYYNYV